MPTKSKFDCSAEADALTSDEFQLSVPVFALLQEAQTVATFFRDHFRADKKSGRPGLADAKVSPAIADEIEALIPVISLAQSKYLLTVDPGADTNKVDRATFILDEIESVMEFYLDDNVENEDDVRLTNIVGERKNMPETTAALALALEQHAELAAPHSHEIDGLGGFDSKLIAEAKKLAVELRGMGGPATPSPASKSALAHRNRLLQLLDSRIRRVRSVTRFVFRAEPALVRGVLSAYERNRRVAAKRAATRKNHKKPAAPAPTPIA